MVETSTQNTSAGKAAARNWSANLDALRRSQPNLIDQLPSLPDDVEWVFARDEALTAIEGTRWWGGCSLPARSAEFMLRQADLPGPVICFLHPIHAAQLRFALDRMLAGQALLALVPQSRTLRVVLACEDFSADISAHRLFFAAGETWEAELDQLLEQNPGLPTPTQFIRPIFVDSSPADALVDPAQKIFADHSSRRAERVRIIRENWRPPGLRRICVVAPSHFRLWDDIGHALAGALADGTGGISVSRFDSDDPISASPAALAASAAECDAIIAPNSGRADLPGLANDEMPWVTWLTAPRIPSAEKAGPRDALLVVDPEWKKLAVKQGWSEDRVFTAGWPGASSAAHAEETAPPGVFRIPEQPALAIIADTRPLDPPERVSEYSSHRILWEAIREELLEDPFALARSPEEFLSAWMKRARVENDGFDRALFIDHVILHSWQQGVARLLTREGIPFKVYGNGWSEVENVRPRALEPVKSREQWHAAVRSAAALVHVRPSNHAHPIDSSGKPVVRAHLKRDIFLRDARLALSGRLPAVQRKVEVLSAETILRALCWI